MSTLTGGIILIGEDLDNKWNITAPKSGRIKKMSELIDSAVMPGIQGGPLMHVIAGKAVAFEEALKPDYKEYCKQVVSNASTLAKSMKELGYSLISGGTDTHLILIDLSDKNITGRLAENKLEEAGITTNKNMIPYDEKSPFITSGIRIGTPALTSRGMKNDEMLFIAELIDKVLSNIEDEIIIKEVNKEVRNLCTSFKLYENLV